MDDFAAAREKMVDSQLMTENVTDYDVLAAMGSIPRERFVPEGQRALAYVDRDVPLGTAERGTPRFLMEPAPFARMVQLAEITRGDVVLDVGCGTGYSAAVLASLAKSVVALESDARMAGEARANLAALGIGNAKVVIGGLEGGYPASGPYDVIFLEGAVETIPPLLFNQLRERGRLVAVIGAGGSGVATLYTRSDGEIGRRVAFNAGINPLPGFRATEAFVF